MAEFNYNIPVPQINTSMFGGNLIQGLSAIEGIKASRAQQEQAAMMAPLQLQAAQLGIQGQQQQMAQSAAAARRAEFGFQQQLQALQAEKARQQEVGNAFNNFVSSEEAGTEALLPVIGKLNKAELDAATAAAQIRLGQIASKMDPNDPDPKSVQKIGQLSALLPSKEAERYDNILKAMPNKYRDGLVNTMQDAAMFGMSGDNIGAFKLINDQISAFAKDPNPVAQRMSKELQSALDILPEEAPPAIWANLAYSHLLKVDQKKADSFLGFLKERAPEQVAKTESETSLKKAETRLKDLEADFKESGGIDPEKKVAREMQMKQAFESEPLVKNYVARKDFVTAVQLAKELKSIPGDASAIVAAIKINDPTSTVSVTEAGQITGGTIPAAFRSLVAKVNEEGKLSEKDRDDLIRMSERRMKDSENQYNAYLKKNQEVAKRYGLDPENIFILPDAPVESVLGKKPPQTRQEQLKNKSVPPPVPTGAAPVGTGMSAIDAAIQKYRSK
jgi:hypothetical protein